MAKNGLKEKNLISSIPPMYPMLLETENGGVEPLEIWCRDTTFLNRLPAAVSVVIGLNDTCCKKGCGKFYLFQIHRRSGQYKARFESYCAFEEVTELFYILEGWSHESQKTWKSMSREEQWQDVKSLRGQVPCHTPLLPLSLDTSAKKFFRMEGLTSEPVTINLTPQPYVGLTSDLRALCTLEANYGEKNQPTGMCYTLKYAKASNQVATSLSKWKVSGIDGIVDKVEEIFRQGPKENIVEYNTLLSQMETASARAAIAEQPYGILGEDTTWKEPVGKGCREKRN